MVEAAYINDRSRRIQRLGYQIDLADHFIILRMSSRIKRGIKGLIKWAPSDDRRMIEITLYALHPLWQKQFQASGSGHIQSPGTELAPGKVT